MSLTPASFLASVRGSHCNLGYRNGPDAATVDFWQDLFRRPIIVVPSADGVALLCLYENDTDLRLVRINTARKFVPSSPAGSNRLSTIVRSATCDVQEAMIEDWQEVLNHLKNTPVSSLGHEVVKSWPSVVNWDPIPVRLRLQGQIKFMVDNGATHWPVTTTLR